MTRDNELPQTPTEVAAFMDQLAFEPAPAADALRALTLLRPVRRVA